MFLEAHKPKKNMQRYQEKKEHNRNRISVYILVRKLDLEAVGMRKSVTPAGNRTPVARPYTERAIPAPVLLVRN
jgi:hypothetical protein